jgi:dephospho-CoA kinase
MPKMKKKLVLGITGGIASGKTTVMTMLAKAGIPTINSDDLAHACIKRGTPAYRAILQHFGEEIVDPNQEINRGRLGKIVFANSAERRQLEKIVHPCVATKLKHFIQSHAGTIALDIPLLFEAKYESWVDKIIVVYCSKAEQLRRLQARNGLSRGEALRRIAAQIPLSVKRSRADIVIDNTRTLAYLRRQIDRLMI